MRKCTAAAVLMVVVLVTSTSSAAAQSAMLKLPDKSQAARLTQRIGLTDLTIDYHRPLAAGRKIFGGLQGYGEVWRAGADLNTTIQFTDPVSVEGHPLPKGIYGLHMIPGENSWIVMFSNNSTSWGSFYYDSTEDALRVTVKPESIPPQNVLAYSFDDPTPSSVVLTMRWDRIAVPIRIDIDTRHLVAQSLRDQLRGRAGSEWQAYEEVANYLLENSLNANEALQDADQSISIEDRFENEITRARALTALGRTDEARVAQTKALNTMGTQPQIYEFGRSLQRVGQQSAAMQVYRDDIQKHTNTWMSHQEQARVAVFSGDYDAAVREISLAISLAPAPSKPNLQDLLREVQNKVDINR